MTPSELAIRSDLLDLIDAAVASGSNQDRLDLLTASAIRIRAMNTEHDAVCTARGTAEAQVAILTAEVQPIAVTPLP